jgi:hypothetical protein
MTTPENNYTVFHIFHSSCARCSAQQADRKRQCIVYQFRWLWELFVAIPPATRRRAPGIMQHRPEYIHTYRARQYLTEQHLAASLIQTSNSNLCLAADTCGSAYNMKLKLRNMKPILGALLVGFIIIISLMFYVMLCMYAACRGVDGGGGEWCGRSLRQRPRGGKMNILNKKNRFSVPTTF